jgi:hypothetical protein
VLLSRVGTGLDVSCSVAQISPNPTTNPTQPRTPTGALGPGVLRAEMSTS